MPGAFNELEDLQVQLRSHGGDLERLKRVMSKVMANVYVGKDMSMLFPDIVMLTRVQESSIKRLIGMFTTEYAHLHPDTALLCVNQLAKEVMQDADPIQRGHALQTLSSLNIPNLAEYIAPPIKHALQDLSPYVRRLAVYACVKLHHVNHDVFEDQLLAPHLKEMLEDFDEQVVTSAVTALAEIQPGFKIPKGIATKILKRLSDFTEWQIPIIFRSIDSPALCSNDSEVFDLLNILDSYLDDCSAAIVLHVITLLTPLTTTDAMKQQLEKRIKGPLLLKIRHATPEISFWCCRQICHIITDKNLLNSDYKLFYPSYFDPTYLKAEKVKMLMNITTADNVNAIVQELLKCLSSPKHSDIASEIVDAVTVPLLKYGDHMSKVVVQISTMLQIGSACTVSVVLPCVEQLVHCHKDTAVILLPRLQRCAEFDLSPAADAALLSMLGSHGDMLPECTAMLYCYVSQYEQWSANVRRALLTACMRQYNLRGMSSVVSELLMKVQQDNEPLLKSRAAFYSKLLIKDILTTITDNQGQCNINPAAPAIEDHFNNLPVTVRDKAANSQTAQPEPNTDLIDVLHPAPPSIAPVNHSNDILGDLSVNRPSTPSQELLDIFGSQSNQPSPKPSPQATLPDPDLVKRLDKSRKFLTTLAVPTLLPAQYEEHWAKPCQQQRYKTLLTNTSVTAATVGAVGGTMAHYKLSTMAASADTADPLQLFLYTASAGFIILAKLQISVSNNLLEVEVRCDNSMIGSMSCRAVEHILSHPAYFP